AASADLFENIVSPPSRVRGPQFARKNRAMPVVSQVDFGTLKVTVRVSQINFCFLKVVMMPKLALSALGVLVRKKRGARKLREVATEIGITAPTLMRIEAGRVPDVATFGKVCRWLGVDPGDFLGSPSRTAAQSRPIAEPAIRVSAHFKAD